MCPKKYEKRPLTSCVRLLTQSSAQFFFCSSTYIFPARACPATGEKCALAPSYVCVASRVLTLRTSCMNFRLETRNVRLLLRSNMFEASRQMSRRSFLFIYLCPARECFRVEMRNARSFRLCGFKTVDVFFCSSICVLIMVRIGCAAVGRS